MHGTLHLIDLSDTGPLLIADPDRGEVEWDRLLQSLVLRCCDLFGDEPEPEQADAGLQNFQSTFQTLHGTSFGSTLRDARRTGALGDLSEEAQATLLGGTLYAYGGPNSDTDDVSVPSAMMNRMRAALDLDSTFGSAPLIERRDRSGEFQPDIVDLDELFPDTPAVSSVDVAAQMSTLRGMLLQDLQAQLMNTTGTGWWAGGSAAAAPGRGALGSWDSTLVGTSSHIDAPEVVVVRPPSDAPTEDFEGTIDFNGTSMLGSDHMRTMRTERGNTISRLGAGTTGFLGETVISETDRAFFETLMPEEEGQMQAVEGGLAEILHRLNDASLGDSLMRSVRRVLQLTTVLTGQRLSDAEINRLPNISFDRAEDQCCAICLDCFRPGELLTELRCNHFFHVDCVSRWFQRSAQCPLCRAQQGEDLGPELLS